MSRKAARAQSESLVSVESESQIHESESEEEVLQEDKVYDCKADVYWLMSIRILHLMDNQAFKLHKAEYIIGLVHSILVYGLCLGLQLVITAFLMLAAARTEVGFHSDFTKKNEITLVQATANLIKSLDTTGLTDAAADHKDATLGECVAQLNVRYEWIYIVMIFVWLLSMLIEFRDVVADFTVLKNMAKCRKGDRMFADDGSTVISLKPGARIALMILGPGVRFLVAVVLLFAGCKVLFFRQSMMFVVLCSMSLGFVVSLDDLVISALAGPTTVKELEDLKLSYTHGITRMHAQWMGGLGGITHLAICVAFAAIYCEVIETDVTTFREACWAYHAKFPEQLSPQQTMLTFSEMFQTMIEHAFDGVNPWHNTLDVATTTTTAAP